MAEIRFHRNDYDRLVSEEFYSVKSAPNYDIYEETTNKKVAIWTDRNGGILKYNKSKALISWLKQNSYLRIDENHGLVGPLYIDKMTEPEAIVKIESLLLTDFKEFKIIGKEYIPGDTLYNFVLETGLDDIITYSTEMSRPKLILKMNEFKSEFSAKVSEMFALVGVNIRSYQFAKNENKLRFSISVLLSRTQIQDWVNGKVNTLKIK